MKVLFVVPYAPTQIRTRPLNLIRALRGQGHDVTVATLWAGEQEHRGLDALEAVGVRIVAERLPLARSAWNCLRALAGPEPLQANYSWSPRLAQRLRVLVEQTPFDVVHVEHLRGVRYGLMLARQVAGRSRRPALVWDSVDCISLLFRRALQDSLVPRARLAARLELRRTERYEGRATTGFDRVLVTSYEDRNELMRLTSRMDGRVPSPIEVVPNGVDIDYFAPSAEAREPFTIVVTGKMSYHANVTAVRWLAEQVMPRVWAAVPEARLWIVGKDPSRDVQALGVPWAGPPGEVPAPHARVLVTGTVPDVRPFLRRAAVAAAPIRYGVGIQNKVLEAMACGSALVATEQAVAGVRAQAGSDLVVASSPAEFSQAIVALLKDRAMRERIGQAARAFVERAHDWRRVGAVMTDIYRHAHA